MLRKLLAISFALLVSSRLLATNFVLGNMCFEVLDEEEHTASLALCWAKTDTVNVPENVEWKGEHYRVVEIATLALRNSTAMRILNIPQTCVKIHTTALYYSPVLERINVAQGNTAYSDIDGVLYSKDHHTLCFYPQGRMNETYRIPTGVTTIANNAFFKCGKLQQLLFPDSTTYIGQSACSGCHAMTAVSLPEHLAEIASYAFYDCPNLKTVRVLGNGEFKMGECMFSYLTYIDGELQLSGSVSRQVIERFRKIGFSKVSFY